MHTTTLPSRYGERKFIVGVPENLHRMTDIQRARFKAVRDVFVPSLEWEHCGGL